jgi:hypothetical protein
MCLKRIGKIGEVEKMKSRVTVLSTLLASLTVAAVCLGVPSANGEVITIPATAPAPPVQVSPAPPLPYGASDVMKMYQSGINKDIILNYINNSTTACHLNADAIIYLQSIGFPQDIVQALIVRDGQLRQMGYANANAANAANAAANAAAMAAAGQAGPPQYQYPQVAVPTTPAPDISDYSVDYSDYGYPYYGYPYYYAGYPYYYGAYWGPGWGWGWGGHRGWGRGFHGGFGGFHGGFRGGGFHEGFGGFHGGGFHGGFAGGGFHGGLAGGGFHGGLAGGHAGFGGGGHGGFGGGHSGGGHR